MGAVEDELALLPPCTRPWGPATTRQLARLLGVYLTLVALGSALLLRAPQDALQIFGLGLLWPGAGFLAHLVWHGQCPGPASGVVLLGRVGRQHAPWRHPERAAQGGVHVDVLGGL